MKIFAYSVMLCLTLQLPAVGTDILSTPFKRGAFSLMGCKGPLLDTCISKRKAIKEFMYHSIENLDRGLDALPTSAMPVVRMLINAWRTTHHTIREQKAAAAREDMMITKTPSLRIAHQEAVAHAIKLVITLYSPQEHRYDRMKALFALNALHLLGKKEQLIHQFIARNNRHYFTREGALKSYDPSHANNNEPKRIKELITFLRLISTNQKEYYDYLKEGLSKGITELAWALQPDALKEIKEQGSFWKYASGMFFNITGLDVGAWRKVEPALVCARKSNQDFMTLIALCDNATENSTALQKAKMLINTYTGPMHRIMQQYYDDACRHK